MPNNKTEKINVRMPLYLRIRLQEGKTSIKELKWRCP